MVYYLIDQHHLSYNSGMHNVQHSRAMLQRGVCELAHFFFHFSLTCMTDFNISGEDLVGCQNLLLILLTYSIKYVQNETKTKPVFGNVWTR